MRSHVAAAAVAVLVGVVDPGSAAMATAVVCQETQEKTVSGQDGITAEIKGRLTRAAGGGLQITASGVTWSLDVSADDELRQQADPLAGGSVLAAGTVGMPKTAAGGRPVFFVRSIDAAAKGARTEYVDVTVKGTIRTGIVAIGAETTGATISAYGITWELELDGRQRELASRLNGATAVVSGELRAQRGVEIGTRTILRVRQLQ